MLGKTEVEGAPVGMALGAAVIMLGLLLGAELVLGFWLPRLEGFPDGALLGTAEIMLGRTLGAAPTVGISLPTLDGC